MWLAVVASALASGPLAGVPMAIAPNGTAPQAAPPGAAGLKPDSPNVDAGGVVIKTWGFLRETTDALGSHAQDVLRVREDLKSMGADVAAQRAAWSAASQQLATENRALEAQAAAAANVDVTGPQALVAQLESQLVAAQEETRLARQNRTTLDLAWQGKQAAHVAQVKAMNTRIQQVTTQMALAKESFGQAMNQARLSKTTLETQVANLNQQIAALRAQDAALAAQAQHNATMLQDQKLFLQRQGAAVAGDLPKVQQELMKAGPLTASIPSEQADLAQVQAQLAHEQGTCAEHLSTLRDVLRAEQAKVANRAGEVARCSSVGAQNAWLEEQIAQTCPSSAAMQR